VPNALVIPQNAVLTSAAGSTFAIAIDNESKPHLRKSPSASATKERGR